MSDIIVDIPIEQSSEPLLKPAKSKKVRSAKQIEHFENVVKQKRSEHIEKTKKEKQIAAARLLLSIEPKTIDKKKIKKKIVLPEVITDSEESENNSEDSSSDDEPIIKKIEVKAKHFKSQKNKKSNIKVHTNVNNDVIMKNYFCD